MRWNLEAEGRDPDLGGEVDDGEIYILAVKVNRRDKHRKLTLGSPYTLKTLKENVKRLGLYQDLDDETR